MWLEPEYETEETEEKTEKNIAKQTLGNGHTVGFKSFMMCIIVYFVYTNHPT